MNKIVLVFTSLLLVAPSATLWAGPTPGVLYDISGTNLGIGTCEADGTNCSGDITTCNTGEFLVISTGRYSFFKGICDDSVPGQECDGLTFLEEDCVTGVRQDGAMVSVSFRGNARACYADPAVDCTGDLPPSVVVAEATDRGQSRIVLSTTPAPDQVTAEATFTKTWPFTINGKQVKMKLRTIVSTGTLQPDPTGDNCEAANAALGLPPGCGFAASVFDAEGGGPQ